MADYHFVYKDVEGASTQWDDIQRPLGNLPPNPEPSKPPPFAPRLDPDEQPRKKRLPELREAAKAAGFGSVPPIAGSDFVREVSQAPSDVWFVVFLYKDG